MKPQHSGLRSKKLGLFGPFALASLFGAVLLVFAALYLVSQFDRAAQAREEQMVAHGFGQRIDEFAVATVPQIDWDDAVAHLDRQFDAQWADLNVATFLYSVSGFKSAFILDASEKTIYAAVDGGRSAPVAAEPYRHAIRQLIPEIRRQEADRKPLQRRPLSKEMISTPIQAKSIALVNGVPQIMIATLVQPDFGTVMPSKRAPIVITARPIDQAMLGRFADRYLVSALRLTGPDQAVPDQAKLQLKGIDGQAVAQLVWNPQKPGTTLVRRLGIPLAIALILFGIVAVRLFRRSAAMASDLISSEARAKHLAYHDSLTQLPNRALMFERLRQSLSLSRRSGASIAVHCIDLDRFKEVNDTLGHNAGDELIQQVAKRLLECCRESDTISRLGGDEFVILQVNTTVAGAARLTERISAALRAPFELEYGTVDIGCSIGVTLVGGVNCELDAVEALRQSDLALYRSKERGRMRATFFEPEMDAALKLRRSLESDLRKAMTNGELRLVYQPQVDQAGAIQAAEALLRWDHPVRGAVPPGLFVPLAEESGLILDLGEYVFKQVFAETREWRRVRIAINVSAVQLRSASFLPMLTRLVRQSGIDTANYEIELTETALLGDDAVTTRNIERLKKLGFSIALDDFGTGYSSLSVLQRFAVDKIKIDRSFVSSLGASDESEALVDAMIKLARALRLRVIAEGVETDAQRRRLVSCGCAHFQGFLVSEAIPAAQIEAMSGEAVES